MKYSILICIAWAIAGLITGISLGWLQWISIKDLGTKNRGKIIYTQYLFSALRILFVSWIMFLAFRQGFIYGISLLLPFFIGRWTWTLLVLNRKNRIKE
jgi:hypothetical protein